MYFTAYTILLDHSPCVCLAPQFWGSKAPKALALQQCHKNSADWRPWLPQPWGWEIPHATHMCHGPLKQWMVGWFYYCWWLEKSGYHQLRLVVEIPLFTRVSAINSSYSYYEFPFWGKLGSIFRCRLLLVSTKYTHITPNWKLTWIPKISKNCWLFLLGISFPRGLFLRCHVSLLFKILAPNSCGCQFIS